MNHQNTTLKKAMIEALEKSLCVVTSACKQVGINRSTHYEWIKNDPEYADQVKNLENIVLDFAESQLHKQIKDGNTTATIFLLKTKGKGRGYIERQEVVTDSDNFFKVEIVDGDKD
jgi:ACT domain-containing protein